MKASCSFLCLVALPLALSSQEPQEDDAPPPLPDKWPSQSAPESNEDSSSAPDPSSNAAEETFSEPGILQTKSTTYRDVEVLRVTANLVYVRHSRGMASIPLSELPSAYLNLITALDMVPSPSEPPAPAQKSSSSLKVASATQRGKAPERSVVKPTHYIIIPRRPINLPGRNPVAIPRGLPPGGLIPLNHPNVFPNTLSDPHQRELARRDLFLNSRNLPAAPSINPPIAH
ncbi:MAG: hypothetical protein AAF191_06975 [Verrucomicrobiota bacterium]